MANTAAVAIVGATGLVGRQIIETLEEREFPLSNLQLFASPNSAGEEIGCGGLTARVELLDTARFAGTDIVFMAAGARVSAEWAGRASDSGAIVIDSSQLYVGDPDVPLIVPEINAAALAEVSSRNLLTSPDPIAIAASVALHPLQQAAGIRRAVITTFEPVSGAGRAGIEELQQQTLRLMNGQDSEVSVFPQRIAFNVLPQLGEFLDGGNTEEEAAAVAAVGRLLDVVDLPIAITRVRVPTFFGSALAINLETESTIEAEAVREALRQAPGLLLVDELESGTHPTPADAIGTDATYVGRVRCNVDLSLVDLWVAIDNIRKGSALNAVQIAELLLRDHL
jgi:aspartate-semialdehyde dehydrogenase